MSKRTNKEWSKQEDELLAELVASKEHKIFELVPYFPRRSEKSIRNHIHQLGLSTGRLGRGWKWTKKEDAMLTEAVNSGTMSLKAIHETLFPKHSYRSMRKRITHLGLTPYRVRISPPDWTEEEDAKLLWILNEYVPRNRVLPYDVPEAAAKVLPERSWAQVRQRVNQLQREGVDVELYRFTVGK